MRKPRTCPSIVVPIAAETIDQARGGRKPFPAIVSLAVIVSVSDAGPFFCGASFRTSSSYLPE
jgi:hypothetical protein